MKNKAKSTGQIILRAIFGLFVVAFNISTKTFNFKKSLGSASAIVLLMLIGFQATQTFAGTCSTAPAGLVSWYQGENNAIDFVGTNNGTIQGNVTFTTGKVGQTFTLGGTGNTSGVGDRVIVGNPANLQLQDFTIEGWIKRSSNTIVTNSPLAPFESGIFFSYGLNGYGFFIQQSTGRIGLTKIGVNNITSNLTVTDTNFHHIAVTKSGNQVTFYVDGIADTPITYTSTFTFGTNAAIGARGDNDVRNAFFGSIDELSIYNVALTATEIQAIFAADSAGKCFMVNTFTVTNTNDSGAGSLRQAILDANNTAGTDMVVFDSSFNSPQTITLTGGEMLISNANVMINGPGANLLTVSGNATSRIFTILETPVVNISGMTLTGGNGVGSLATNAGGAIFNQGELTLTNMVIGTMTTGNSATGFGGGVFNDANDSLTVVNSTFSNNTAGNQGGGIFHQVSQSLSITDSTFTGNSAAREGGGLYANGLGVSAANPITISGSTFSNNSITGPSPTGGGGIGLFNMTANITNSTISGNTSTNSGGGIRSFGTTLTLSYTTIAGNSTTASGGGIYRENSGSVNFHGTLIGDNSASAGGPDLSGTAFVSGNYNLIENTSGATITGTTTNNITGQDPMLAPLANNTGPTQTHALMFGSPAIDAGDTMNFPATDQRGVMRPIDGNPGNFVAQPDIGAFEATAPTSANVLIAGRVTNGFRGLSNVVVVLTDMSGNSVSIRTNSFGYFRFEQVSVGQTYILNIYAKQYQFGPQIINVMEEITNLEISPSWK